MIHFLIVTGMSGAGKTVAIRYLEDLGALCVDNLPPMMLVPFMGACQGTHLRNPMIAIAADIRSGEFFDAKAVTKMIDEARLVGFVIETLFIEARDDVLVNRYKETRREHPLSGEGLTLEEAIREERARLQPLRETANHLLDTSELRPRALQKQLAEIVLHVDEAPPLRVEILSFGFKRGIPREGDLVFDVRFLPNPFYIAELGHHTGLDEDVRDFVLNHPVTREFLVKCMDMLEFLLPHYITEELKDNERYQTVYAKTPGSAAAPTAGLHFTPQLLKQIEATGVGIGYVTLHVGLGTFRPVKTEKIEDHKMHSEWYSIPQKTAGLILRTKEQGGRVICVGTTSCRTVESAASTGGIRACEGTTDIFIYPGYSFKCLDGLITNFHLPESTLIMLVSALAGYEHTMAAYREAVRERYRFFSFGDAMAIL